MSWSEGLYLIGRGRQGSIAHDDSVKDLVLFHLGGDILKSFMGDGFLFLDKVDDDVFGGVPFWRNDDDSVIELIFAREGFFRELLDLLRYVVTWISSMRTSVLQHFEDRVVGRERLCLVVKIHINFGRNPQVKLTRSQLAS
jgi:hypothetical protein